SSDPELRDKVASASQSIIELAKKHDLHFTREELADVFREKFSDSADESGGATPMTPIFSERPGV
ncbi:MAG TPA: Nif11-like leader peptide family natural product precursor, partial [Longimicrobiales bacterium]|nr:Nif11-like leader peptide family natural product precursor [Longimicrobiales bacterium]